MNSEDKEKKALKFLKLNGTYKVLENIKEAFLQGYGDDEDLQESEELKKIVTEAIVSEEMQGNFLTLFAEFHCDNLTEEELDQLIEFYETPIGQKYRQVSEQMPELIDKITEFTQAAIAKKLMEHGYNNSTGD